MTIYGWDASDYDWARGPMDLGAARRDGIDFFTHKATENTNVTHDRFGEAMSRARDAGIPVLGAYHVVRSPRNARAEVDFHLAYVDRHAPWWRTHPAWFWQVDLEMWPYDSVPAVEGEDFADIIENLTGRKAVIYASAGQYGGQLAGTSHDLWNANYPTWRTAAGSCPAEPYRDSYVHSGGDQGPGWGAYSGRVPALWQYSSNATIGSQRGCDANAYRGTLDQFIALIDSRTGDDVGTAQEIIAAWSVGVDHTPDGQVVAPVVWRTRDETWQADVSRRLAADEVRGRATLAAIEALASGGTSIDTAAVIARIDAATAVESAAVAALSAKVTDLRARLAAAERAAGEAAGSELD